MKRLGMFFLGLSVLPVTAALLLAMTYGYAAGWMYLGALPEPAYILGAIMAAGSLALGASAAAY